MGDETLQRRFKVPQQGATPKMMKISCGAAIEVEPGRDVLGLEPLETLGNPEETPVE